MSADDLRINLWSLEDSNVSFNIVDIKPANMEELTEVITAACFHPVSCNLFMYSSSRGAIKLADMRDSALCDAHSKGKTRTDTRSPPAADPFFFCVVQASLTLPPFLPPSLARSV